MLAKAVLSSASAEGKGKVMAYLLCYLSPFVRSLHFLTKEASKNVFSVSLCVQNFGGLQLLSTFLLHIEQQFERI